MKASDVMSLQSAYVASVALSGAKNLPPGGETMVREIVARLPTAAVDIADIGCNTGWVTLELAKALPRASLHGFDVDVGMVEQARERGQGVGNASFSVLDCIHLRSRGLRFDAVVCGGSSAFFGDRSAVYRAVADALSDNGLFIDVQYVYHARPPASLLERERVAFGVTCRAPTAAAWLTDYEGTGLSVVTFKRFPPFTLTDSTEAAFYQSVLRGVPGFATVVQDLVDRRSVAQALSVHRAPGLFVLDRVRPPARAASAAPPKTLDPRRLAVMEVFADAFERRPIDAIRRLSPYGFLAYIGDPDAAPGGGRSVARIVRWLQELGLDADADLVDVGAFTGLSTIVLARDFPAVVGIDIVPEFLAAARAVATKFDSPARFRLDDARTSTLAPSSADAVVLTATLGYTPDPDAIVRSMHRVLRDNGIIVEFLYDYDETGPEDTARLRDRVSANLRCRSLSAQVAMFEAAGFVLERCERLDDVDERVPTDPMEHWIIERERMRNAALSRADLDEFRTILRRYASRTELDGPRPRVYLCAFRKAPLPDSEKQP